MIANRLDTHRARDGEHAAAHAAAPRSSTWRATSRARSITGDNRLLASAEGLPVHVIGMEFLAEAMTELHDDLDEGDAFLHNDPYLGNTHPADHVILVPVFWRGTARLHRGGQGAPGRLRQRPADHVHALRARRLRGGRLIFPAVRVQRDYRGHRRRHPHVPAPDPRPRPVVRRLPGDGRRSADRRGAAQGAVREVRARDDRALRRGVVRLLGAAHRPRHLADAEGHDHRRRHARPVRARCPTASRSTSRSPSIPTPG